jgi:hypothetical protein
MMTPSGGFVPASANDSVFAPFAASVGLNATVTGPVIL